MLLKNKLTPWGGAQFSEIFYEVNGHQLLQKLQKNTQYIFMHGKQNISTNFYS